MKLQTTPNDLACAIVTEGETRMEARPLLMRLGMSDQDPVTLPQTDVTELERLPFVVEVRTGVLLQTNTRLTEVKRETTDDN